MDHNFPLKKILRLFFTQEPEKITYLNGGHIHQTYLIKTSNSEKFILQKINTTIFSDPGQLMMNINAVTTHIRDKALQLGKDPSKSTLTILPTLSGSLYHSEINGDWRMFQFIKNTFSREKPQSLEEVYDAALVTGEFLKYLVDFPVKTLIPPLPDFHHTPKRLAQLITAIKQAVPTRLNAVKSEIVFIQERADQLDKIQTALDSGIIPWRVTHNDTKFENILLDAHSGKCLCLIDLDTVMPGSPLFDFGDALRAMTNTANEDEPQLTQVNFSLPVYKAYLDGYYASVGDLLNSAEKSLLPYAPWVITLENGMRFLTDYLNGDIYYKTAYPEHNLVRTRTQ